MPSQESFLEIGNNIKGFTSKVKQTYTIFNIENDNFSVFLEDSDHVCAFYYNNKLESLGKIKAEALPKKYRYFLGSSVKGSDQRLYFANSNKSKFGLYRFNFDKGEVEEKELNLGINNETFLNSISIGNNLYFLTVTKSSSILNLYSFDEDKISRRQIDLSESAFVNSKYESEPLSRIFAANSNSSLAKIEDSSPTPVNFAYSFSKLYVINNNIIITLDKSDHATQIISINLDDFKFEVQSVSQPKLNEETIFKKSNSFLVDNSLFQIIYTRNKMVLNVKDYNSKKLLNEHTVYKKEILSLQENKTVNDKKGIKETSRFLKNAAVNYCGISVYTFNDNYQIKLGSYKLQGSGGAFVMTDMGMGYFGLNSATGAINYTPGTPTYSFMSFGRAGSNIIENTLNETLDRNFNFFSNNHQENVFDKAKKYIDTNKDNIIGETIFKYKNSFILGFYKRGTNIYSLLKFND